MVDFKSKIYYEDNDEIIGAEVTVYSQEGDNIGSIQVTSKQDFDDLKARLDGLDETYVLINGLEAALNNITIDAQTLEGYSSTDFARYEHSHANEYAATNHSSTNNTYGLGDTSKYGHNKIINNLNREIYADGEALSAKQGYDLKNLISSLRNELGTWSSQKLGNYGTLRINPVLRLAYFTYYRENYTVSKNVTLHSGLIPSQYRFGGVYKLCSSSVSTILGVNSSGDVFLKTSRTSAATGALRGWWIWLY